MPDNTRTVYVTTAQRMAARALRRRGDKRESVRKIAEARQAETDRIEAVKQHPRGAAPKYRPKVGDDVQAVLKGKLVAYDADLGYWYLQTDGTDHIPWKIELHWAQPFTERSDA